MGFNKEKDSKVTNSKKKHSGLDERIDRLILSKYLYLIISLLFLCIFGFIFKWQHIIKVFDKSYYADTALLGQYGDFVGGVLGTIFALLSTLLLVRTFKQQQISTKISEEQADNQRFNDLFFELLRLYQSEVSELCGKWEIGKSSCISYSNKDFFDVEKRRLQKAFIPQKSFDYNRKEAIFFYTQFYIEHQVKLGACFRTLYRIYDMIDSSTLKESVKKEYLKIIRAQLTASELFFIRYNCMSYYGKPFIKYVNRYNILKHLPAFELLEFKDWWAQLTYVERAGLSVVFYQGAKTLKSLLAKQQTKRYHFYKKSYDRYKYEINVIDNYEINILLILDCTKKNKYIEYQGFDKFTPRHIQALIDCFLKELLLYSNFGKFNNKYDLNFYSSPIKYINDTYLISSGVRNEQKEPLRV